MPILRWPQAREAASGPVCTGSSAQCGATLALLPVYRMPLAGVHPVHLRVRQLYGNDVSLLEFALSYSERVRTILGCLMMRCYATL